MEQRLVPVNAVLDLAVADGLNPAPLAAAGWRAAALEVPVIGGTGTVVCDVVLFNAETGHLLAVEAKSGANIEPEQGRRLISLSAEQLIVAGGITVPQPVALRCEVLYVCLEEHSDRIALSVEQADLPVPILAVSNHGARLVRAGLASSQLAAALGEPVVWTHPIARIVPFDHESPAGAFDQPVRAELIAAIAQGRSHVTIRALTEQVVRHFAIYGRSAQGRLVRRVRESARRAAEANTTDFRCFRLPGVLR